MGETDKLKEEINLLKIQLFGLEAKHIAISKTLMTLCKNIDDPFKGDVIRFYDQQFKLEFESAFALENEKMKALLLPYVKSFQKL